MNAGTLFGQIITFYSYKGGTGRSMALSNVSCLLAQSIGVNGGVLTIDWDLEAPGLPYYLLDQSEAIRVHPQSGVVELFTQLQDMVLNHHQFVDPENFDAIREVLFDKIDLTRYVTPTKMPGLDLMPAGHIDNSYQRRLVNIDWQRLYSRLPSLYRHFATFLAQKYDYVLVDSRTGMTDISNICTTLLPDKLIVVFTPNRQSLNGVDSLIMQATEYRRLSRDLRPLMVYPLPSRIDNQRDALRTLWRLGDKAIDFEGYEHRFERILSTAYGLTACSMFDYFEEIQIQHSPDQSYGETVVALEPSSSDRFSLLRSYQALVARIVTSGAPWETTDVINARVRYDQLKAQIDNYFREHGGLGGADGTPIPYGSALIELIELSTKINGDGSVATVSARRNYIDFVLLDNTQEAIAAIDSLFLIFPTLSPTLRLGCIAFGATCSAKLRKAGNLSGSVLLRQKLKDALDRDKDLGAGAGLSELLPIVNLLSSEGHWVEADELSDMIVEKASREGNVDLAVETSMERIQILKNRKRISEAVQLCYQTLDLINKKADRNDEDVKKILQDLVDLRLADGDLLGSIESQERLVRALETSSGSEAPETLKSIEALADKFCALAERDRDETRFEFALRLLERATGPGDEKVRILSDKLASLRQQRDAIETKEREVATAREQSRAAPDDLNLSLGVATALMGLGEQQLAFGDLDRALGGYLEALDLLERLVHSTPENPDFLRQFAESEMRTGDIFARQNRYQEALKYYVKGFEQTRRGQSASEGSSRSTELLRLQSELRRRIDDTRLQTIADGRL